MRPARTQQESPLRASPIHVFASAALLLLTSAPAAAQYRFEFTRASDDGILQGPRRVIQASTQVEGSWNLRFYPWHGSGQHKASFDWVSGQEESFKLTYDRPNQQFRLDVSGTVVVTPKLTPNDYGRLQGTDTLFVRCLATHPGTTAQIRVTDLFAYTTILEPVNELVQASSLDGKPAILRIGGAPFDQGFRIGGTIRFDFPDTPDVQLNKDLLTCELFAMESGSGDRDGDSVPNGQDVCPDAYDPLQLDADGDGTGDACRPPRGLEATGNASGDTKSEADVLQKDGREEDGEGGDAAATDPGADEAEAAPARGPGGRLQDTPERPPSMGPVWLLAVLWVALAMAAVLMVAGVVARHRR